jgi:glycosyltransferase involved in cell wall biosynthesis
MENKNKALVSIIVPVYNAENFLDKCVGSILAQTYSNWELILINDGSKDNSGKICDDYAAKDNRIKLIHKQNSGVSDTRNVGIASSQGDNICFVDADDWLKPKFLEHLMQFSHIDYVMAGYETSPEHSKCILEEKSYDRANIHEVFDKYLQTRPTSCATLFKANIIKDNHIQFNTKLRSREDHIFVVQYLKWIKSVQAVNYQEYIVRSRTVPIAVKFRMHSDDIILVIDSLLKAYKDIKDEFGYYPSNLRPTYNIMSQYYLDDFCRLQSDDDYWSIYSKYFNTNDSKEMYSNTTLSSINLLIDGIVAYRSLKDSNKVDQLAATLVTIKRSAGDSFVAYRSQEYSKITENLLKGNTKRAFRWIDYLNAKIRAKGVMKKLARPFFYALR